ncbi:carbonic anhydrase 4-like [Trichomycterus rosablanca]|uniref:carbonic anhydrase 4-like n=1 Tax=Trichomycterus rosablanca TaxID=2290929 RepID=UPI002F3582C9
MRFFISALLLTLLYSICTGEDWCYQSQVDCQSHCKGPDLWHEVHTDCEKKRQSPINIVTKKTHLDSRLTPLIFSGYQQAFIGNLTNNGHSVQVGVQIHATISGGNLKHTYKAVQLHFHWGKDGGPGSEHTIDGEQYPMELHIVHMREDFKSLSDALKDSSGVAVLGFFYEESKSTNRKYDQFINALKNVKKYETSTAIDKFSLSNLLLSEGNMTNYYRYEGSLTTPQCTEAVIWTVFEHPIPLSKEQLSEFSNLKFSDEKPMVNSFRPVQPLWGRSVYYSGTSALVASFSLILVCVNAALGLFQPN